MMTEIWTRVELPGIHHWPEAPEHRGYLAGPHRHLFVITVWVPVDGTNREVEFHDLQDMVRAVWGAVTRDCGASSCETLALEMAAELRTRFRVDPSRVEVSEDGESGAVVTWQ